MPILCVLFSPDSLVEHGIPGDKQASVYVQELFGVPASEIYGYTGDRKTAYKIRRILKKRYNNPGRLRKLKPDWFTQEIYHTFAL